MMWRRCDKCSNRYEIMQPITADSSSRERLCLDCYSNEPIQTLTQNHYSDPLENPIQKRLGGVRTIVMNHRSIKPISNKSAEVNSSNKNHDEEFFRILNKASEASEIYKEATQYLPLLYVALCRIVSAQADWTAKMIANAGLTYLTLDKPWNERRADGTELLHKTYVCALALRNIRDKVSLELVSVATHDFVHHSGKPFVETIYDILSYCESQPELETNTAKEVIKSSTIENTHDLREDQPRPIEIRKRKIKLLYAMLAVKCKPYADRRYGGSTHSNRAREFIINHPQFYEIERYRAVLRK